MGEFCIYRCSCCLDIWKRGVYTHLPTDTWKDDQINNSMVNKREKYAKNTISNGVYFGMLNVTLPGGKWRFRLGFFYEPKKVSLKWYSVKEMEEFLLWLFGSLQTWGHACSWTDEMFGSSLYRCQLSLGRNLYYYLLLGLGQWLKILKALLGDY